MPDHNGFHGHIVWVNPASRKFTYNDKIDEHNHCISRNNKTVTCFIPAESGRFFAATWWCKERNDRTAQPYTVEFIRDGESVHRAVFNRKASARIRGIAGEWIDPDGNDIDRHYYFMFRGMEVTGEDEHSTVVPDYIGRLEIVIRKMKDDELSEDDDDENNSLTSSKDNSDGEEDSDMDDNDTDDVESDQSDGETYYPKHGQLTKVKKIQNSPRKTKTTRKSPPPHATYTDWCEKKPRHTHTAEMARCNGMLWQDHRRYHVPTFRAPLDSDEEDIIVRFIFNYTSMEHIETCLGSNPQTVPQVSSSSSSRIQQLPREDPPNSQSRAGKRRRLDPTPPVKTEDEERIYNESLYYLEMANKRMRALDASMRARGCAAEGDKGNPIKVED